MSTPQELLETYRPALNKPDEETLRHSTMPTQWFNRWISRIIEAQNSGHRDLMAARNVPAELLDELQDRHTVYLYTSAKKANAEEAQSALETSLENEEDSLHEYLNLVERTMRYAHRSDKAEMENIIDISKGTGPDNEINDLRRYHEISIRKPQALTDINEDATIFAEALWSRHEKLSGLKAAVDNAPDMTNEEMILMHRAYTHLMNSVDEIVACAEFLFGKDSPEFEPYRAEYYAELGKKSGKARLAKAESENSEDEIDESFEM